MKRKWRTHGKTLYKTCIRKTRFVTKQEASIGKEDLEIKLQISIRIYPCGFCKGFHLTKLPK